MTAMMPAHYDPTNGGLAAIYDHTGIGAGAMGHGHPGGAHGAGHPVAMPQKPKLFFKMPRVVHDQKSKFENDELFRRLARESEVSLRHNRTNLKSRTEAFQLRQKGCN